MSEVLVEYDASVKATDGSRWKPRACGRAGDDGLWEGWIEFLPTNTAAQPIRSGRESVQPNRADLMYWAQGLTQVYLEGALRRALSDRPTVRRAEVASTPYFDAPADKSQRPRESTDPT